MSLAVENLLERPAPGMIRPSQYGADTPNRQPAMRAADLPGMVGLSIPELFPDIPRAIYTEGDDLEPVYQATIAALENVDMSMIQERSTVNILVSQYGFMIMGGYAYREMVRAIKETVERRTGCKHIRLRVTTGFRLKEPEEVIEFYKLNELFDGQALPALYIDQGVPIETPIGTLMGVKRVYDADFIIHAHHGELRELDMHRMMSRTMKPFSMSYARFETRSVHHLNFGPRSSNVVPRMIFESDFVQKKWTFGVFMATSPQGVTGIEAGNDLMPIDRKLALLAFKSYGKIRELLNEIKDCVVIIDGSGEPRYMPGGGTTFANLTEAGLDLFDLDTVPVSLGYGIYQPPPWQPRHKAVNPAIKAIVMNYYWLGVPQMELPGSAPTFLVGDEMAKFVTEDYMNTEMIKKCVTAVDLPTAVEFAKRVAGTDNIVAFDGAYGSLTCSESMARHLIECKARVDRRVDVDLMPKWLRQHGIDQNEAL